MRNYGREQNKYLLNKQGKENEVGLAIHYVNHNMQYKDTHGLEPSWYKEEA